MLNDVLKSSSELFSLQKKMKTGLNSEVCSFYHAMVGNWLVTFSIFTSQKGEVTTDSSVYISCTCVIHPLPALLLSQP